MSYFTANQSLSHGTMRNEDLLQSFAGALDGVIAQEGAKQDSHVRLVAEATAILALYDDVDDCEEASDVVNALFDALNYYSPEGTSFGSHEGDGSDYGFWSYDDESDVVLDDRAERERML